MKFYLEHGNWLGSAAFAGAKLSARHSVVARLCV